MIVNVFVHYKNKQAVFWPKNQNFACLYTGVFLLFGKDNPSPHSAYLGEAQRYSCLKAGGD